MSQTRDHRDADEQALLGLLPADGSPADSLCDLTGVALSYPGHGGATVTAPGSMVANSLGFRLEVDARTLDVTITVSGLGHNA